jgi:hypothetical protein
MGEENIMKILKSNCGTEVKVCDRDYDLFKGMKINITHDGYARVYWHVYVGPGKYKSKSVLLHIMILGKRQSKVIDHINEDKLDNRRCNLRFASRGQNAVNSSKKKNQYKGVGKDRKSGRYVARYHHNEKSVVIGYFPTAIEAAKARDLVIFEKYGPSSYFNLGVPKRYEIL